MGIEEAVGWVSLIPLCHAEGRGTGLRSWNLVRTLYAT